MDAAVNQKTRTALVAAIRGLSAAAAAGGETLVRAVWAEADGSAGYLIHADGRMLAFGDYQMGWSNLAELEQPLASKDAALAEELRAEAGQIAGSASVPDADDWADLAQEVVSVFSETEARLVERGDRPDRAFVEEIFELATRAPAPRPVDVGYATGRATLVRDMEAAVLVKSDAGRLAWEKRILARKGELVECNDGQHQGPRCAIAVPGGYLYADKQDLTGFQPKQKPCHRPHP